MSFSSQIHETIEEEGEPQEAVEVPDQMENPEDVPVEEETAAPAEEPAAEVPHYVFVLLLLSTIYLSALKTLPITFEQ